MRLYDGGRAPNPRRVRIRLDLLQYGGLERCCGWVRMFAARPWQIDRHVERNLAFAKNKNAVGERNGFRNIVSDEDRGETMLKPDSLRKFMHISAGERVEKSVELRIELPTGAPPMLADEHQLQQVLINLATNAQHALKATAAPRRLTLAARHDAAARRMRIEARVVAEQGRAVRADDLVGVPQVEEHVRMIERRLRASVFYAASYWNTAWIDAGRPDLTDLDPPETTRRNQSLLVEESALWARDRLFPLGPAVEYPPSLFSADR